MLKSYEARIGTRWQPFTVLTELGWVVSGPMTSKRRQNVSRFAFNENVKITNQRNQSVEEGTAGTKVVREYDEVYRRAARSANAVE